MNNGEIFKRTKMLIGSGGLEILRSKKVAVFGVGGVGSYAAEALVRAGVGKLMLVDPDSVNETNLNRQLLALHSTIGRKKVEVARERFLDINPALEISVFDVFYAEDTAASVSIDDCDFVIDAIDTVSSKLLLIKAAKEKNIDIISCMGTGNKLRAEFLISDIKETSVCPLAKVMRKKLKEIGIGELKVLWSKESPAEPEIKLEENGRHIPASISFVPSVAGLLIAGEAVRTLLGKKI